MIAGNRKEGTQMSRNFYFGKAANIVNGSANFGTLISATPTAYGLTAGQATAFAALNTALQSAYATAIEPTTRSPVAIQAKNLAIRNMRNSAKLLAKIAYATSTVTDAQLVALGLLPRTSPSPRPIPTEAPILEVVSVSGRLVTIRIHDAASESRRKAPGAVGANIFSYVGAAAPADPGAYRYEGMATRSTMELLFPNSVASGATVWLSAQWITARGQTSVGSSPMSFTLQGGAVVAAAA